MHIHSQLPFPSDLPPAFPMRPDHFHPSPHDPAVDFRTFYPYTPNEVKHRKRTTSAQLKILEDVFKRDTKPNAQLRNDLASQLEMTPRGVQVWFQNRRAKEKNKASKLTLSKTFSQPSPSPNDLSSAASPSVKEDPAAADELGQSPAQHESSPEVPDASATPSATTPPSPPQLQVITDPSNPSWNHDSADDLPPDSASSVVPQPNPFPPSDLYAYRRGSLPVNAFPSPSPERDGPPSIDAFDPLARRRSVDASLQRLANNPYAPLARAKNGALFGPRYGVVPAPRYNIPGRAPYGQRPGLANHATTSHFLDMRRSSVDPRAFRFSSTRGNLSPSPSPLSPYHGTRASLPDHSLYAVTSRPLISPIPGPLPSPHFSFGDASTPSMTSPSSGESERNSPDSLRSFPFRSDERDEDDRISSVSYDAYSRFGSIASVATSESSLHSAYYSDIGGTAVDADLSANLRSDRHDSCTPGQFLAMVPGLDANGQQSLTDPMPNTLGLASYGPQDEFSASTADGVSVIEGGDSRTDSSASYPSPASTISPGGGSPHTQDGQPATTPPSTVPISRTSELAFALQSRPDQAQTMHSSIPSQEHLQSSNYSQSTHQDSPSDSGLSTGVPESSTSTFYYPHQADHGDQRNVDASVPNADFNPNYGAECDSNVFSAGHFGPAGYDSVGNSYPIDGPGDHSLQPHHHQQHHQQQHPQLEYPQVCSMPDIYAPYSDSMVSSIDNTISGMDSYISYN